MLLVIISREYLKRKTEILQVLELIYLFFVLAMLANLIGMWLHYIVFVEAGQTYEPGEGFLNYLWKLFIDYRIAFVFSIFGIYFSFIFKEMVFEKEMNPKKKKFMITVGILILLFTVLVYQWH